MITYFLSRVLLFECGRAGLCTGKLFGPSMLRDIIRLRFTAAACPFIYDDVDDVIDALVLLSLLLSILLLADKTPPFVDNDSAL